MKYYSDTTHKLYETQEELIAAEFAAKEEEDRKKKLADERVAREKAIDKMMDDCVEAMKAFYDDYKTFPCLNHLKGYKTGFWKI